MKLLKNKKRNNLCILPRRWGKTSFVIYLLSKLAIKKENQRLAYSAPTAKLMLQMWEDLTSILEPIITRISREDRTVKLINGSLINLWSSDDPQSGRGRKYHIWLHDECQRDRNLNKFIKGSVRPTLADYQGELWILGTANGIGSELHDFYLECLTDSSWQVAQGHISDNPYIEKEEIDIMFRDMGPSLAAQELESQWVRVDGVAPLVRESTWKELYGLLPDEGRFVPRVMAFDGSVTGDLSVLVAVSHINHTDHYYVDYDDIITFSPSDGIEGEIDYDHVEKVIWGLWQTGRYAVIAYDKYQAVAMMQRLKRKGVKVLEINQNSTRLSADSFLRQLINESRIHHPDHDELNEHMYAATTKYVGNGAIRIVKGSKKHKIDLAVALSMAVWANKILNPGSFQEYKPTVGTQYKEPTVIQAKDNPFEYLKRLSPFRK